MPLTIGAIAVDCNDAAALAGFYSHLLEVPVDDGASRFFASIGRSNEAEPRHGTILFLAVPDKTPGKNALHLDLITSGPREEQVARAVELGAEKVRDVEKWGFAWTTLRDPEGNLFDIAAHE
ncbi:MAG: VOC family protein [Tetrasphaera sp.]